MSLNDSANGAAQQKVEHLAKDAARYCVRGILGGAYLTLGTGFALIAGHAVERVAPGNDLGALVYALFFGLGLYSIIILGAELATGNMMYMAYAATRRAVTWGKALWVMVLSTLMNLAGCLLFGLLLAHSAAFMDLGPEHLASTLTDDSLRKGTGQLLIEGVLANLVVNMAVLGGIFAKDYAGKFLTVVLLIAIFVGLGVEHVIANFSLMSIVMFSAGMPLESMTAGTVAANWVLVWIGNVIGGGLLMGAVYGWLNGGHESYRD